MERKGKLEVCEVRIIKARIVAPTTLVKGQSSPVAPNRRLKFFSLKQSASNFFETHLCEAESRVTMSSIALPNAGTRCVYTIGLTESKAGKVVRVANTSSA